MSVQRFGLVMGVVAALVAAPAIAQAAEGMGGAKWTCSLTKDYTASSWTSETSWSGRAVGKLGYGLKNLLLGWTDLFVEPKEAMDAGGNILSGLGTGLVQGVGNTVGGALHVVTFPLTELDVPLPEGGVSVL